MRKLAQVNPHSFLFENTKKLGKIMVGKAEEEKFKEQPTVNRKKINVSQENLVKTDFFCPENSLPLIINPITDGVNITTWALRNNDFINVHLMKYGGILFRNPIVNGTDEFEQFIKATSEGELLEYTYRSTRRSQVNARIYTSTEYPSNQSIPLHNENSYSSTWPMKIWFFCMKPSEKGGETPIADSRKIYERLDSAIKDRFIQKKVMYVRNYGELDLSWQEVFQTTSKSEVESYCRKSGIEYEWMGSSNLRTSQVCEAVAKHPKTNEMVWFNQAHLFHFSGLPPEVSESLLSIFGEEGIPRNAYYGDGSPIEISVLNEIREIYNSESVTFLWQTGDILMLDNMLTAHGRMPFTGTRNIMVGMAEPFSG